MNGKDEHRTRTAVPVPHSVFRVVDAPPGERFGLWKESISCIFDVEAERETRLLDFDAEVEAWLLGQLMLARTTSRAQSWRRSASTIARDGMDHYMVQLFAEGEMEAGDGPRSTFADGQALVVFDLAREMTSRTPSFTNLSLVIPREALSDALFAPDDQHMRTLRTAEPLAAMLRDHLVALTRVGRRLTTTQAREVSRATTTMVAACLNGCEHAAGLDAAPRVAQLGTCKRLIEQNLSDPGLSASQICGTAGLSRTKLYALFAPLGGVNAHIRERRLRRALSALADPRNRFRPVYEIAATCGFRNESAFSRAFRRRFGRSPREARHEGVDLAPAARTASGAGHRYEHWLHHLAV
ncbi:helix-turn-helix domain-containing protein [Lutibaculum baratangense]|uniref:Transcriptional regulator n=1 Tax=Lutibaculum baratangense AMV1 TaxID=631454 RepID=V4RHW6_9HYPH|nr:helix-turn-helix domain-containing protein [Lutibaculum baratangense]ESR24904.1 transcriptional regulator [Lutibaculum baratangense AMV1]